jgi:fatty acid desaturase
VRFARADTFNGHAAARLLRSAAVREIMISFLDSSGQNGTRLDDVLDGRNLALLPWAAVPLLNFNLHGAHHRHPASP